MEDFMKKNVKVIGIVVSIGLILSSLTSCSSEVVEPGGVTFKACINSIEISAKYNGNTRLFRGSISGSTITLNLPSNIDTWTDRRICIGLDYNESIQLNGTGTSYNSSNSESIDFPLADLSTILVKGGNGYEDQTYSVTINRKLYVDYNPNYTGGIANWSSVVPSTTLYSTGDRITLPTSEVERYVNTYRQLGWSTSSTAVTPEYNLGSEINVTSSMVNAGVLDLYVTWSRYCVGQLLENVQDVDGNAQTGYVAYICGNNDTVKANSSKPNTNWTYLIVSKYGAARLTGKTWQEANSGFSGNAYLPSKTEMKKIIDNLWEASGNRKWQIFSDGSSTALGWDDYWTASDDDADHDKAYYASVTTNYEGNYRGLVSSSRAKTETLKAIGVSYIN